MSTRISFFSIKPLKSEMFAEVLRKISGENFSDLSPSGFLISHQTNSSIEGRYVQKISDVLKVVDPLGNTLEFPRVTFFEQRFQLRIKSPQLTLFNPNSAAQSFFGRLLEFADFKISTEPMEFPTKLFLKELSDIFANVHVYAVSLDEFNLDDCSTAKITVESSADARLRAKVFLKPRSVEFNTLKCEFEYANRLRRCELRSGGSITIFGESDPILEENFTSIVSKISVQS